MTSTRRSRLAGMSVLLTALVIGLIVFLATQANARPGSQTTTNDGGAWLVNRQAGYVAHANRLVGELSDSTKVGEPSQPIDVYQPAGLITVHDQTNLALTLVDERTHGVRSKIELPELAEIHEYRHGLVITAPAPDRIWRLSTTRLAELERLLDLPPLISSDVPLTVAVSADGNLGYAEENGSVWVLPIGADTADAATRARGDFPTPVQSGVRDLTFVGRTLVSLHDSGDVVVYEQTGPARFQADESLEQAMLLSHPTRTNDQLLLMSAEDGTLITLDRITSAWTAAVTGVGEEAVRPIHYNGCGHGLTQTPLVLTRICAGGEAEQHVLGDGGGTVRLRLVNGWVWLNDVENGSFWLSRPGELPSRVDDWGNVLPRESLGDSDDEQVSGGGDGAENQVENPDAADAETVRADDFDEDGINQPPVANDDGGQTIVGRPIRIDVMANDVDPDNDVLIVESVENLSPAAGQVVVSPNSDAVQVSPEAGFVGSIRFRYTINDGRGATSSASVSVLVTEPDGASNRPPEPVTDVGFVRAGELLLMNVLLNDRDPDGDLLVLESVEAESGTVQFDPSGQIIFEPDTTSLEGEVELTYVVSDDYGQNGEGKVRVAIRSVSESNLPPDARNDLVVTNVGQPASINLLENDTDPDGDALFVAQRPELFSPEGAEVNTTISPDGEFVVLAEIPGTYVFSYAASDGGASDTAQIRVQVGQPGANRPPVALRDDTIIPVGSTRIVYALDNDGDPDGDIVGIVDLQVSPDSGLIVEDFQGIGFKVTVRENAPSRPLFRYSISDGLSDPVTAAVVVATSPPSSLDQPPVARADVVEMRSGRVLSVPVLVNDFDPEGGSLRVVAVSQPEGAAASVGPDGQSVRVDVDAETVTSFTMSYDLADEAGNRSASVLRVQIVPEGQANRPPIARPDVTRTEHDTPVAVRVLRNDTDPDGDIIGLDFVRSQPEHGRVTIDPLTSELLYEPDPTFSGTDRFVYSIIDSLGANAEGEVFIGVMAPERLNTPPDALDDSVAMTEGAAPVFIDVLVNDIDLDGDQLRVTDIEPATWGIVELLDGEVRYTPPAPIDADLADTFEYRITDGQGGSDTALVTVLVTDITEAELEVLQAEPTPTPQPTPTPVPPPTPTPVPDEDEPEPIPPIAVDDLVGPVRAGQSVSVNVLLNDSDPDGDNADLTVQAEIPGASIVAGEVIFVAPTESGVYRYTITDLDGLTASATISVEVVELLAPIALDDVVGPVSAGETVEVPILANDTDPDGGVVQFAGSTAGSFSGSALVLTAPSATAQYTYTIVDSDGLSATGLVTVLVADNRAPNVVPLSISTPFETAITIDLGAQATDPDGDPLFFSCCSSPRGGGTSVQNSGPDSLTVTFQPDKDFEGLAGFSYTVDDQFGHIVSGSVTIEVDKSPEASNEPPVATAAQIEVKVESTATLDLAPLASDPDENDTLVWTLGNLAGSGLSTSLSGTVLSVSADDSAQPGTSSVTYTVRDDEGASASAPIAISILPPDNEPPVATGGTVQVPAGSQVTVNLNDHASDPDAGDLLTYQLVTSPAEQGLSATLAGDIVTIQASINETGLGSSFSYRASDRWSAASTALFSIEVIEPDVAKPKAIDDTAETFQGQAVTVNVLGNDVDPIGDGLTIISPGATSSGSTSAAGDNIVFAPDPTFFGTATFTYKIQDIAGSVTREDTGTVQIDVIGRPDKPAPPGVVPDAGKVTLTWTTPPNNGDPVDLYEIEHDQGGSKAPGLTNSDTWTGLNNGTAYLFRVRAHNAAGWSDWSEWSVTVTPDIKPEVPAAPTCEGADSQVVVNWSAPNNGGSPILGYELQQVGGNVQPTGVESYTWSGLNNGTGYTFQVRAENQAGFSTWSASSQVCTPSTTPGVPTLLDTTRGDGFLIVNWTPLTPGNDGGNPVSSYNLRVVGTGLSASVQGANTGSYNWPNLQNGVEYVFEVQAVNTNGPGVWSTPSSGLAPCGVPATPAGLTIDAPDPDDSQINLSWPTPADNGCPILEVLLDWGAGSATLPGSAVAHTLTGRSNGTQYSVNLSVKNDVGWSGASAAVVSTPAGAPLCGSNYQVQAEAVGVRTVDLTWSSALDNGRPINDYQVSIDGGGWQSFGAATSHTFGGLGGNGLAYVFQVRAHNDVGPSEVCGQAAATTCDVPNQLPAPTLTIENVINLRGDWTQGTVGGDSCPQVTDYGTWMPAVGQEPETGTTHTWLDLNPRSYHFTVRACNDVGCGDWSADSNEVTIVLPDPVVTAEAGSNGGATCDSGDCRWLRVKSVVDLKASSTYTVRCYAGPTAASATALIHTGTVVTNAAGAITQFSPCSYDDDKWVDVQFSGPAPYPGGPTSVSSGAIRLRP